MGPRLESPAELVPRGKAVLVGDAAHAQPPNLGQGANLTFQNSLSLATYLDRVGAWRTPWPSGSAASAR